MKIAIVQFYTPDVRYGKYSEDINRLYCEQHGYLYFVEKDSKKIFDNIGIDRHPTWYKPFLIAKVFKKHNPDWVLYLDADAAINDFNQKIEDYIDTKYDFLLSDDVGHHSDFNAGVILVKNSQWSKYFLDRWYKSAEEFTGKSAEALDIACLQEEHYNLKGVFKSVLWHDQTCLTLLSRDPAIRSKIKQIPKEKFNHSELYQNNFIFHGFGKGMYPYRELDKLYKSVMPKEHNTYPEINLVVYHSYACGDYMDVCTRQLDRVINSGLYDWADKIVICHTDTSGNFDNFTNLVKQKDRDNKVDLHTSVKNLYESEAIIKVWEFSQQYNGKVFYFHTKGVFNKFVSVDSNEISEWKVNSIKHWKELLEYFLIDNFEDCVKQLDTVDQCGVTCNGGWWWGNFWWSTLDWIRINEKHEYATRWADEAWLNASRTGYKIHEYFHMDYNPYYTILPDDIHLRSYADATMEVIGAYYGTTGIQKDEGQPYVERVVNDVTEIMKKHVEQHNGKGICMFVHNGDFGDPIYGYVKTLEVRVKIEGKEYVLAQQEGLTLNFMLK